MGALLVYLLKSAVWLIAFYLFYRLFLCRETLHRLNRMTLVSVLALSFLLPFLSRTGFRPVAETAFPQEGAGQELFVLHPYEASYSVIPYLLQGIWLLYIAGVLFFLVKTGWSFLQLYRTVRHRQRIRLEDGIQVVLLPEEMAPFSWGNYIVLSQSDWEGQTQEILLHETGHIRMRHSRDLVLAQLAVIFQWFNPAVWLLKQELQTIHEYEADEFVLRKGVEASAYQMLLIRKAVGELRFISVTNNFNHSKLKKRITMMLREKSTHRAQLKYLFILPLLAVVLLCFAQPGVEDELAGWSEVHWTGAEVLRRIQAGPAIEKGDTIIPSVLEPLPLILLDGEEMENSRFSTVNPQDIQQIEVLKDQSATKVYGEKGKHGVVLITTKRGKEIPEQTLPVPGTMGPGRVSGNDSRTGIQLEEFSPIITMKEREEARRIRINGREVSAEELRELKKNNLAGEVKTIEVVKDPEANTGIIHISTENEE